MHRILLLEGRGGYGAEEIMSGRGGGGLDAIPRALDRLPYGLRAFVNWSRIYA